MEAAAITLASIILTLRSMHELIPAANKTHIKKTSGREICLVIELDKIDEIIQLITSYLKNYPSQTITVEKIIIDPQKPEYILVLDTKAFNHLAQQYQLIPISDVWTNDWQQNYVIGEIDEFPIKPIAIQYTLSYKYEKLYYLSEQFIYPKPTNYFITGIDQFKWKHLISRKHLDKYQLILNDNLIEKIKS